MRVALYGRYSSEGQREASIEDQYRNCEARVEKEGWQIVARYADKGISGTQDEQGRKGYAALLTAARAKAFDVCLVDDLCGSRAIRSNARKRGGCLCTWGCASSEYRTELIPLLRGTRRCPASRA